MPAKKTTASRNATGKKSTGFSKEERAAMRERAKELKAEATESDVLAKIAEMPSSDRTIGKRIHEIVKEVAPDLAPRLWYGMPAYAKDGKILCFFQSADKFKSRYASFGFTDEANLDDGAMWPTYFGIKKMTDAEQAKIKKLVKKAVS